MAGKGGDALIVVGCDASAVKKAAAEAVSAWKDVGRSLSSSLGEATQSIVNDLSRVATAQGQVSFSSQHAQVREFEAATARMATSAGRDLGSVRSAAEATGVAIGKRPSEVIAWTAEVGRLTGRFDDAGKSIRGFAGLAAATNRSVDDYRGLAVELQNVGHVAGDSTHALGVMTAQAEMLGTTGGPAAFADQVLGLQDTISHFAVKSEADFLKVTAAAAVFGKGLNQAASGRVQQSIMSMTTADPYLLKRMLGHSVVDEHGQVKDAVGTAFEIRDFIKKTYGSGSNGTAILARMPGMNYESAAALMNANRSEVNAAANAKPSKTNEEAIKKYLGTDAGGREVAEATLAQSSRELLGSSTALGRAADALQRFTASHPIVGTFSATAAAGLSAAIATAVGKSVTLAMRAGVNSGAGAVGLGGGGAAGVGGAVLKNLPLIGAGLAADAAFEEFLNQQHVGHGITFGDLRGGSYGGIDKDATRAAVASASKDTVDAFRRENVAIAQSGLSDVDKKAASSAATKVFAANPAMANGGSTMIAALVAELRKMGQSDAGADKIAKVLDERLRDMTIDVTNATDTPITATVKSSHSSSAGKQGG